MKSLFERVTEGVVRNNYSLSVVDLRKRCEEIEREGERMFSTKLDEHFGAPTFNRYEESTHEVLVIPMRELKPKDERPTKDEVVEFMRDFAETQDPNWLKFNKFIDRIEKYGINSSGGEG